MDIDNEFGEYMTESVIRYEDTGDKILINCTWDEIPNIMEPFEDRIKYLFKLPSRLSYCFSTEQTKYLIENINKIPEANLKDAAIALNPRSYRLSDWMITMEKCIPEDYSFDGSKLFSGLIFELNKFIPIEKDE